MASLLALVTSRQLRETAQLAAATELLAIIARNLGNTMEGVEAGHCPADPEVPGSSAWHPGHLPPHRILPGYVKVLARLPPFLHHQAGPFTPKAAAEAVRQLHHCIDPNFATAHIYMIPVVAANKKFHAYQ
jgi:hypothetical protein